MCNKSNQINIIIFLAQLAVEFKEVSVLQSFVKTKLAKFLVFDAARIERHRRYFQVIYRSFMYTTLQYR